MRHDIKFIYWNKTGKKHACLKVKIGRKTYRCGAYLDAESWIQSIGSRGVVTIENQCGQRVTFENVKVKNHYKEKV